MKKVLINAIYFAIFGQFCFAQPTNTLSTITLEEAFGARMPTKVDTFYYPFYDGVQMIEIDHIGYWDKKIFFLEQSQPRAMPHSMFHPMPIGNEFLFRDTTGQIIKVYSNEYPLDSLNKYFKNIPIDKKHGLSIFFPYHSNQDYRNRGSWYQSPNHAFNFSGHYKVFTGTTTKFLQSNTDKTQQIKYGLIDSLGNIIIPIEYDEIYPLNEKLLVQKNKKWGIIDYQQTEIIPLKYDDYKVNNFSYYQDLQKNTSIFFITAKNYINYDMPYNYDAIFLLEENKLIPLNNYDEIYTTNWSTANNQFIGIIKDGKKGLLNKEYKEVIAPQYEIFDYHYDYKLIRVAKNGKFGFLDKNLKKIIPMQYDYADFFLEDSISLLLKSGEFYCIDPQGKKEPYCNLKPKWQIRGLEFVIDSNYVCIETNNVFGIIDTLSNAIILPIKYKSLTPTDIINFFDKNKEIFEQKKFQQTSTPDIYDEILYHDNKIIVKNKRNLYGVIDTAFNIVINFQYETLQMVKYNLKYLIYSKKRKSGVIDFSGKNIIASDYNEIRYSMNIDEERETFQVKKNNKWGIVNFESKILVPCEYDSICFLGHWNREKALLWIVEKNKKFGVINDKNEIFVPFEYDGISHLNGNTLWVEDKDKKRYKVEL